MALFPTSIFFNPAKVFSDPGVHSRKVGVGTPSSEGNNSYQGIEVTGLLRYQRACDRQLEIQGSLFFFLTSRISLACILPWGLGTDHTLLNNTSSVVIVTLGIVYSSHVHTHQHVRLGSPKRKCSPTCHRGQHVVIILSWLLGETDRGHLGGEGDWLAESEDSNVVCIGVAEGIRR